jgi:peptide/nickel transport system substrate-binding protein
MKKSIAVLVLSLVLLVAMLAGCSTATPAAQTTTQAITQPTTQTPTQSTAATTTQSKPSKPLIMKYLITEPQSFYPPDQKTGNELIQYQLPYESLGRIDNNGDVQPFLASKFVVDAPNKTITIVVRPGVKFSDGTICDGTAIKWNLDQFIAAGRLEIGKPALSVNSDGNVVCKLDTWQNNILTQIAARFIESPTSFQNGGTTDDARKTFAKSHPVGTGAFTLKEWVPGVSLTYVKNPNYRLAGQPYIDEVDIIPQPDQTIAKTQFLAGDIDLYTPSDSGVAKQLLDAGYKNIAPQGPVATRSLVPNSKDKTVVVGGKTVDNILYDPDIRKAVSLAIDRNGLVQAMSGGIDSPSTQWMFPTSPYYVKELDSIRGYNLTQAQQIMTSKGYSASKMCSVTLWTTAQNLPYATAIQGMLSNAYLQVDIKSVQFSEISKMMGINGTSWDGMLVMLTAIYMNPLDYYGTVFSSSPSQYVMGIDRTKTIPADELLAKYSQFAGMTIPQVYNYALTTDKGDSLLAIQALTYYVGYEDVVIGTVSLGSNTFTSKRLSGVNPLLGSQWTPELLKLTQ